MKKDVLIISHATATLLPTDNDRLPYLAKMLHNSGAQVELVTSDFEHHKKAYRNKSNASLWPFKITYIHETAYSKNVSLKRVFAHKVFAKNLKKYLKNRKKPDVIYCRIPPTFSAKVAAQYAKKNHIRFIVDVEDLWPESFMIALGNNFFSKALLKPMANVVNYAYKQADAICACSETYVQRVSRVNTKATEKVCAFLGADGSEVDKALSAPIDKIGEDNEFKIAYVGNIGASYDFENLFRALQALSKKGYKNIKLFIFGDGNYREKIEKMATNFFPNTKIFGYLPFAKMMGYVKQCDIAVNPIIKGTFSSIVTKVGDYAAASLPVINTQDNAEYRELVETFNVGINTVPEDSQSIADAIERLYTDPARRKAMGKNNRRLFDEKFDRLKTYPSIIRLILE